MIDVFIDFAGKKCLLSTILLKNAKAWKERKTFIGKDGPQRALEVKEIVAAVKQLKQLQIKPRKNSEAPTGFEPMTSVIPVRCSTDWAIKPR